MGIFVCVAAGVVSKYLLFLCLLNVKFSFPNNASQQCFPEVTNFGMASKIICDNLSGEEIHSIH
jgi:hypothetical protein